MPRTGFLTMYERTGLTHEDMEQRLVFVRESCERDGLPNWLTTAVLERLKAEYLEAIGGYIPHIWAERLAAAMKPLIYQEPKEQ